MRLTKEKMLNFRFYLFFLRLIISLVNISSWRNLNKYELIMINLIMKKS